jgi:hypothetical protein
LRQDRPNAEVRVYNDAGYFARNVLTIEVLVNRDAVASGASAADEPSNSTRQPSTST